MPRPGSIPADIVAYLKVRQSAATIQEIVDYLDDVRRFQVPRHSVRSALYQHLNGQGEDLFARKARGRYMLKD
jgi:hypothetical protein